MRTVSVIVVSLLALIAVFWRVTHPSNETPSAPPPSPSVAVQPVGSPVTLSPPERQEPVEADATPASATRAKRPRASSQKCAMVAGDVYEASVYATMDSTTKLSMAHAPGHGMQGCSAWHLAVSFGAQDDLDSAKYYALMASLALDDPEPLLSVWENYLTGAETIDVNLAYLLFATERWPGHEYLQEITITGYRAADRPLAVESLPRVRELARRIVTRELGAP